MSKKERTLVIIKPDGVMRSLVGEIIGRIEKTGLKLVGMKMTAPDEAHILKHYDAENEEWFKTLGTKAINGYRKHELTPPSEDEKELGHLVVKWLVDYLTSGPVVAMVWQGPHAIEIVRKITGDTEPLSSNTGTMRGDWVHDSFYHANSNNRAVRNLLHASTDTKDAEREIYHWFNDDELFDHKITYEDVVTGE